MLIRLAAAPPRLLLRPSLRHLCTQPPRKPRPLARPHFLSLLLSSSSRSPPSHFAAGAALLLAVAAAAAAAAATAALGPTEASSRARVAWDTLLSALASLAWAGEPDPADLSSLLPPRPPGSPPLLVFALEGTLVDRVYDPHSGWVCAVRPGVVELLLALSRSAAPPEVLLWSRARDASGASEAVVAPLLAACAAADGVRFRAHAAARAAAARSVLAEEVRAAAAEGRAVRRAALGRAGALEGDEAEALASYGARVLRIVAVLGREHCTELARGGLLPVHLLWPEAEAGGARGAAEEVGGARAPPASSAPRRR